MRGDFHVRFCERFGGVIPLTYSIKQNLLYLKSDEM
jgi:hypothetical protein